MMDELEAEQAAARRGAICSFVAVYAGLQKPDGEDLRDALKRPEIAAATIVRVLARHGFKVQSQTVRRHRRGECSCVRI
jgi:hypothetical protein